MNSRIFLSGLVLGAACVVQGQDQHGDRRDFESVGVRYGFGATAISDDFWQAEGIADFATPFRLDLGRDWFVNTRLELALGGFGNDQRESFIASVGPIFFRSRGVTFPSRWKSALPLLDSARRDS